MKSVRWLESTSPVQVAKMRANMFRRNAAYYADREQIEQEAEKRQIQFFQEPLQLGETVRLK